MDNILPTNEFVEIEGRQYLNPQTGIDESNAFIENLRATQGQQNQEIAEQTRNLGTDIPTNLGGLTSADSYFTSRYQTPMTNSAVANLRATAQAQALNEVLANEQAIWKKRYQDAYKNYQKRQNSRARSSYGGGGYTTTEVPQTTAGQGEVETVANDSDTTVTYQGSVTARPGQQVVISPDGVAQGYINGEYVELRPGQTYRPSLNLTPTNSIGQQSPLAPVNALQRR